MWAVLLLIQVENKKMSQTERDSDLIYNNPTKRKQREQK